MSQPCDDDVEGEFIAPVKGDFVAPVIYIAQHTAARDTADLKLRLWRRFSREYAVLFEVPVDGSKLDLSGESAFSRQSIDAVAIGLWRRTSHLVHAFELKVTRSDLVAELRNPIKARAAFDAVDRFWLVVFHRDLIRGVGSQPDLTDQIPPEWGVMVLRGESLTTIKQASSAGGALDRRFVAGLVQTAINRSSAPGLDPAVAAQVPTRRRRRRRRARSA